VAEVVHQQPLKSLRSIIRILIEDLGHLTRSNPRGWGTANPIYVKPLKQSLGDVQEEDLGKDIDQTPVKVSKAFLRAQALDEPAES